MHTMRLAEAKSLENCAYALAVALQANDKVSYHADNAGGAHEKDTNDK